MKTKIDKKKIIEDWKNFRTNVYIRCRICGKEEKLNLNKSVKEEIERLDWAEMTIKKKDYKETSYICGKCFMKICNF